MTCALHVDQIVSPLVPRDGDIMYPSFGQLLPLLS